MAPDRNRAHVVDRIARRCHVPSCADLPHVILGASPTAFRLTALPAGTGTEAQSLAVIGIAEGDDAIIAANLLGPDYCLIFAPLAGYECRKTSSSNLTSLSQGR